MAEKFGYRRFGFWQDWVVHPALGTCLWLLLALLRVQSVGLAPRSAVSSVEPLAQD